MIDIKGIDKAVLLMCLFNRSHQQGLGFLDFGGSKDMTLTEATRELERYVNSPYFHGEIYYDYLRGRVLKVDITGDTLDECLYDRDCGFGAAQEAVNNARKFMEENKNA